MFGKKPKKPEDLEPEAAPPSAPILPEELEVLVEENPAPDTIPAPALHPETLSADHGFPSPRRCAPQE